MASFELFSGDAANQLFAVNMPYIARAHIDVEHPVGTPVAFTWINDTQISATVAPILGTSNVKVVRDTPIGALTDFVDGSALGESDLDRSLLQSLYIAEETQDNDTLNLKKDLADDKYDAQSKVIKLVAEGAADNDAVNVSQVAALTGADVILAAASAAAAATSETNAETSETNAETSETNAATSATNAATSKTNAGTSETNAAVSAAAAVAALGAASWADVAFKTFSDTPIAIVDADSAVMYSIDTSGGDVVVNLPSIAVLTLSGPWSIGFKKTTSDANTITINTDGTDTIDGVASFVISEENGGAVLIPDVDPAFDEWTSSLFGFAIPGNLTVDNFADTTDYTSGRTTQLTISKAPAVKQNLWISFDGVTQHHNTYSVVDTTVTFDAAIPTGTANVEVQIGTVVSIGTPSDDTVTPEKIAALAVETAGIAADAVTYAKIQNIGATQRVLGRNTAGAGDTEEVTLSEFLDWVGSAADGDTLHRASGAWTRLAKGTDGQVMTLASGVPSWGAGTPTGSPILFAAAAADIPSGYLLCDGTAVSRTTYAALFTAIGIIHGNGNGYSTFNVPDMRGKSAIGTNDSGLTAGADSGFTTRDEGDTGGTEAHALVKAEIPAHSHTMVSAGGKGRGGNIANPHLGRSGTIATRASGGGRAHNNMHPFVTMNFIIKT